MSKNQSGNQFVPCGAFGLSESPLLFQTQKRRPLLSLLAGRTARLPNFPLSFSNLVGVTGVEPVTLRLSSACSNQLSYTP